MELNLLLSINAIKSIITIYIPLFPIPKSINFWIGLFKSFIMKI